VVMCLQKRLSSTDETWKLLLEHPVHRYVYMLLYITLLLSAKFSVLNNHTFITLDAVVVII